MGILKQGVRTRLPGRDISREMETAALMTPGLAVPGLQQIILPNMTADTTVTAPFPDYVVKKVTFAKFGQTSATHRAYFRVGGVGDAFEAVFAAGGATQVTFDLAFPLLNGRSLQIAPTANNIGFHVFLSVAPVDLRRHPIAYHAFSSGAAVTYQNRTGVMTADTVFTQIIVRNHSGLANSYSIGTEERGIMQSQPIPVDTSDFLDLNLQVRTGQYLQAGEAQGMVYNAYGYRRDAF